MARTQLRRASGQWWTTNNPTLAPGEPGVDTTAKTLKIGDGKTAWNDLPSTSITAADLSSALDPILDDIADLESGKANIVHTHAISDVTNLQSTLDGKAGSSHTHDTATTTSSGFMSTADKTLVEALRAATTPVISVHPSQGQYATGEAKSIGVTASSILPLSYQVEESANGGSTWSDKAGATANPSSFTLTANDRGKQHRMRVSSVAGVVRSNVSLTPMYALDQYPGAVRAYALELLRKAYAGPLIRVRRSSDSTEQDFTASQITGGGLVSFCGAGSGYVAKWYDQFGLADAGQATASLQPRIVNAGALEVNESGKPTIRFLDSSASASGAYLTMSAWHSASAAWVGMMSIYSLLVDGSVPDVLGATPTNYGLCSTHNASTRTIQTRAARTGGSPAANGPTLDLNRSYLRFDYADRTNVRSYLNTAASASLSVADRNEDFLMPTDYYLGSALALTRICDTRISAVICFNSDATSYQQALRTRLVSDYSIA